MDDVENLEAEVVLGKDSKFTVEVEAYGKKWKFVFHRLSLGERLQVGLREATLRGNKPVEAVDAYANSIAMMLATFEYALDKAPSWFRPAEMIDTDIPFRVYAAYLEKVNEFFRAGKSEEKGDSRVTNRESDLVAGKKI